MAKRRWLVGVVVLGVVAGWSVLSTTAAGAEEATPQIVTYASAESAEDATSEGGELDRADDDSEVIAEQVAVAELTPAEANALRNDRDVIAVEPDGVATVADFPDDTCYSSPASCFTTGAWHVDKVGLPSAWNVSHGDGVIIAVVDSGMASPAISEFSAPNKLLPEVDATPGSPPCTSGSAMYHGTATAALAAAGTDNNLGIPGAGWDARVQPVRVWEGPTCGNNTAISNLIAGIDGARQSGASIVNVSLEAGPSTAMETAVNNTISDGITLVAAAGNSDGTTPRYPAGYAGVISVGATTISDTRASFSNFGPTVEVFAPGDNVVTLDRSGNLIQASGTSFSSPIVAGVAALMKAARPGLTPAQISDALVATADMVNGLPRLDAREAIHRATFNGAGPGAEAISATTIDIASRGVDSSLWSRTLDVAGDGRWANLGGVAIGDPDLASTAAGRLEMAIRGNDNGVWTAVRATPAAAWSAFTRLPQGFINTSPSITSSASGRLDVFGRGLDNALWHARLQNGVFQNWESLGGIITTEPDATSFSDGRMEVFARGANNAMWRRSWTGSQWTPWVSLGGVLTSGPGAVTRSGNRIDIVVRGTDTGVWIRQFNGSTWGAWTGLGGIIVGSPALTSKNGTTLDLIARAPESQLWRRTNNGSSWSPWFKSE